MQKVSLTLSTILKVDNALKMAKTKTKSPNCQQLSGKTHHACLKCIQRFQMDSQWEEAHRYDQLNHYETQASLLRNAYVKLRVLWSSQSKRSMKIRTHFVWDQRAYRSGFPCIVELQESNRNQKVARWASYVLLLPCAMCLYVNQNWKSISNDV